MEQCRLGVDVFPDVGQSSESGSTAVNASNDIKFNADVGRNDASEICELINALDVLLINANMKSTMMSQTKNLGFEKRCRGPLQYSM